ncbi:MAG: twin transmembrane helix small protein [Roseiarcus sp.]|jgi:NADH:ubiquinone oxidoreductase subunit 6 (subunit J)
MSALSNAGVAVAVGAVAVVLVFGLVNMLRQGSGSRSQTLMRWRVGLQFLAIVVIVLVLLTRGR